MTEKELMRKTKAELVAIILEQGDIIRAADDYEAPPTPTTCAECRNYNPTGNYCRFLVHKAKPGSFCSWAVKK